jgi:hypothetical protein
MIVSLPSSGGAVLAARFENPDADLTLTVRVGGSDAGEWKLEPRKGWLERELVLPEALLRPEESLVEISCSGEGRYHSFHYWVLDRGSAREMPATR